MSYWVAVLFTLGSVAWVINGFYLFLPTGNAAVDLYASGYSGALMQPLLLLDKSILNALCFAVIHVPLHGGRARLRPHACGLVWTCMRFRRVSMSSTLSEQ